ncbi:succinate semialdehyde dehydrogenase NADP+ linked [Purpureocillium takamizusanense]|uniref:Succinate semialdehyde dehydrogenase NADP+ linked n=1 Tax=Purpureocillium takamizusanense TaxID=2060973 RepID=A0A9Q8QS48_9HYPO|nr:succinate semialdehyde dehydrogenase NADP+ linked [Purpureocillium takamizusanense]UNI23482.1 succinate semialdehyde dehydrogenase NADP+ linked [Purpureocillium takamizusanense]
MALPRATGLARQGARFLSAAASRTTTTTTTTVRPAAPSRPVLPASLANCTCVAVRPFASSSALQKKRKIAPAANSPSRADDKNPSHSTSSSSSSSSSSSAADNNAVEDPLDFSGLIAAYAPIDAHFKAQLQSVLHGGRFNPSTLGALPVTVKSTEPAAPSGSGSGSGQHDTFPLRELAQVVPRSGRTISLLVNDRAYIKPIMSAVQASREFNQQPQRSEDNDLELLLRVELERRDELARRVKEATQGWRERVRQARTRHDKMLKEGKRTGAVLPDVVKRAEKELQKLQDKKMKEIDAEEAQTMKQLERGN